MLYPCALLLNIVRGNVCCFLVGLFGVGFVGFPSPSFSTERTRPAAFKEVFSLKLQTGLAHFWEWQKNWQKNFQG